MKIEEFLKVVKKKTGINYFDNEPDGLYKYVYNFRKEYPEQKTVTYVEGLEDFAKKISSSLLNGLKLYGILDSNDKEIVYDYNYVCIISQETILEGNILKFIENYNRKYLEEGYTINKIFIDYDMDSEDEYNILKGELNRLPYTVFPINISNDVISKTISKQVIERNLKRYRDRNFTNFLNITKYIDELNDDYMYHPNNVIEKFNTLADKIREESLNKKNLIVYSAVENEIYSIVAAHCNYYNYIPIEFMFCSTGGDYRLLLTELYYDSERMILCDRIRYLQQLPSVLFKITDFGPSLLFIGEKQFTANAYVTSYDSLISDEEDVITVEEIDFSENGMYDVISFFEIYPRLRVENKDEYLSYTIKQLSDSLTKERMNQLGDKKLMEIGILAEDRRCRKELNKFYFKLKEKFKNDIGNLQILTPCNCVFLRHKDSDEIYIAYIKSDNEFNFSIKGEQLALALPIPKFCKVNLGLDKVKYWLPYNASLDIKKILQQLNLRMKGRLNRYLDVLEPPFMGSDENTTIYRYLYFSPSGERIMNIDSLDYFSYLLNNRNSVLFRRDGCPFYKVNFEDEIIHQLDCMGGLNIIKIPTDRNKICLSENTFKEMPVNYENR